MKVNVTEDRRIINISEVEGLKEFDRASIQRWYKKNSDEIWRRIVNIVVNYPTVEGSLILAEVKTKMEKYYTIDRIERDEDSEQVSFRVTLSLN